MRSIERVGQQLGVHAEVAVIAEAGEQGVGDRPDARLDRRAVRDALDHVRGDAFVDVGGLATGDLHEADGRPRSSPATWLTWMLVAPERARHPGVHLEEERHVSDEGRDVVAVRAEREVAVPVHRRGGGEHHRTSRRLAQQPWHLAEVVGHQLAAPLVEGRSGHRREEVRHVQQVLAHRAVQVGAVVQRVHLVHPNAVRTARRSPRWRRAPTPVRRWRAGR